MTRLVIPTFLVGLAVATYVGSDLHGWIAAGLTAAILYLGTTGSRVHDHVLDLPV